jgi:hypothetical protein
MIKYLSVLVFVLSNFIGLTQNYDLNNQWYSIGPEELPSPDSRASAKGIGPIEFIRTTPLEKGLLLAGSLTGGLFYSTDGGEYWLNSGSDNWTNSTSTWADFYPQNQNTWFASSHEKSSKSGKGELGYFGGIHRTFDKGVSWKIIGDYNSFGGQKQVKIYKTVFHPTQIKKMYVVSSKGLFYTNDCLAQDVKWLKDKTFTGETFDLIFVGNRMFVSTKKDKECVLRMDDKFMSSFEELNPSNIAQYTFAKDTYNLYLLINYKVGSDKIYRYNYFDDNFVLISKSQSVSFGSGRVFEVNPHNKNEILVGVSLRLKKWNISANKFERLGTDYHVDVEFVTFDPFDENIIYMANHGGVYISYDKGKSWESKSKGLGVAEVLGMAVGKTDPNQVVIGTYHDGSSVYANWDNDGKYYWKNVNGGDALIPLINPKNNAEVYTSNQYSGGGIYYSSDTAKSVTNIHSKNGLKTTGWEMAASLHPVQSNYLFFNSKHNSGELKGGSNVYRTADASEKMNAEQISNFKLTHQLEKFSIYGIFTSKDHPDLVLAYILHHYKDNKGKSKISHKLFRTFNSLDSSEVVINSWHELELPRKSWLGDIEVDKKNINKMYFSYVYGDDSNLEYPSETGIVCYGKYKSKNYKLKRNSDISYPIVNCKGGKYNLVYSSENNKIMFIATSSGVFMRESSFFGWKNWTKVGYGLPHCMVYGLDYNEENQVLTVGLKGRGVWKITIAEKE